MTEIARLGQLPAPRAEIIAVPFLDGHIPCFVHEDEPMVILKPIAEGMGLSWPRQYAKISADQTACVAFKAIQLPGDDQARKTMGVSLETFTLWLGNLQPSRVKHEARETVMTFKREAGRRLREHFFGALARKPCDDLDLLEGVIAALRADRQRIAVMEAKVAAIEGQHDWFTALGYAKLHDFPTNRPYLARVGTRAGSILRARGEQPVKRQDATFGSINTYPADVLEQAFEAVGA